MCLEKFVVVLSSLQGKQLSMMGRRTLLYANASVEILNSCFHHIRQPGAHRWASVLPLATAPSKCIETSLSSLGGFIVIPTRPIFGVFINTTVLPNFGLFPSVTRASSLSYVIRHPSDPEDTTLSGYNK